MNFNYFESSYDTYDEIFGEHDDFNEWLYNVLKCNSFIITKLIVFGDKSLGGTGEEDYGIMYIDKHNEFTDLNIIDCYYKDAYEYLNGMYHIPNKVSFRIKNVKYPDRPIYKIPLIKALYYSYKHRNERFY